MHAQRACKKSRRERSWLSYLSEEGSCAEADEEEGGNPGSELAAELPPVDARALQVLTQADAHNSASDALAGGCGQAIPAGDTKRARLSSTSQRLLVRKGCCTREWSS